MKVTAGDQLGGDASIPEQTARKGSSPVPSGEAMEPVKKPRKLANISSNVERLQAAKEIAEQAIKARHIFTIAGPYPHVRESLRRRGWIEKFYRLEDAPKRSPRQKKKHASDEEDDDEDDDDGDADDDDAPVEDSAVKPWDEENGLYGIMSRMARNDSPAFIWCIRRDNVDFRFLKKQQMVNHYSRNGAFTTKVGLCMNVRNSRWFNDVDHDTFYPRCYRLSHEEEKAAFIDDYCLTACMSIVRWVIMRHREGYNSSVLSDEEDDGSTDAAVQCPADERAAVDKSPRRERRKKKKIPHRLPTNLLDMALRQCHHWMSFRDSEDLEDTSIGEMLPISWDVFLHQYYDLCHNGGIIPGTKARLQECEAVAARLRNYWPQFDMDGIRNVWIVKPGAKSRGRGITCYDKLSDMLKLVDSVVRKDSKYVVQKYIETPLLVHNTKFDIRQWFLVTDWNPLTIWWYKDCYLRFCKKQFSLADFNEAIHLSNNSIQKHYDVDPERSKSIPDDSMWSSDEFKAYLRAEGHGDGFAEQCLPGMKEAVICALQTTQDIIEYRKSSFELYGADFMLTEDLRPWLIEINSSPSMATSTRVTADLVPCVLEDTVKVLIDRKTDRNCDTGRFELIYKPTPVTVPQYLGISLTVEGVGLRSGSAVTSATASQGASYGCPAPPGGLLITAASIAPPRLSRQPVAPNAIAVAPFARGADDAARKPSNPTPAAGTGEEIGEEKTVVLRLTDGRDAQPANLTLAAATAAAAKLTRTGGEPLLAKRKDRWKNAAGRGADEASSASQGSRVAAGNTPSFGKGAAEDAPPPWPHADDDFWPGQQSETVSAAAAADGSGATESATDRLGAGRRGRETQARPYGSVVGSQRREPGAAAASSQVVVPLEPHRLVLSPPNYFAAPIVRSYLPRHNMQRFRLDNGRRIREAPRWQWQGHSFPEGQTMYFLATNLSQHNA